MKKKTNKCYNLSIFFATCYIVIINNIYNKNRRPFLFQAQQKYENDSLAVSTSSFLFMSVDAFSTFTRQQQQPPQHHSFFQDSRRHSFSTKRKNHEPKICSTILQQAQASSSSSPQEEEEDNETTTLSTTTLSTLETHFSFPLDSWQLDATSEILRGHNTIVCAPTGAGKTVVGEMAVRISLENNMKSIYTTPLKALSNQKFVEFRKIFGVENVGLSTGDMSINRGANIMVMTTEVYRNMAWRSGRTKASNSDEEEDEEEEEDELLSNSVVVLDEFHYMGQKNRGGVWEECIITSPSHTQIVCLSATLPNADTLALWMEKVTNRNTKLIEAVGGRPVPLRYLFASREGLNPLFRDVDAGPGAPKGLLGLRGDGIVPASTKNNKGRKKKKKGGTNNNNNEIETHNQDNFPKGLELNPVLLQAAERRLTKINRKISQMQAVRNSSPYDDDTDDIYWERKRMSPRETKREQQRLLRSEMRKSVPSLSLLLKRLEEKDLLPAIFFIFSRAGCEDAAEMVASFMRNSGGASENNNIRGRQRNEEDDKPRRKRKTRQRGRRRSDGNDDDQDWYNEKSSSKIVQDANGRSFRLNSNYITDDTLSSILEGPGDGTYDAEEADDSSPLSPSRLPFYAKKGMLTLPEVKEVAARIAAFNSENPEIALTHPVIERFLFGVGSHHAGMLPAHKALVETLFRAQLCKVVFATETLAAGINMPARTTAICSMAKRGDVGSMELLETANLLQMAGRAGRRGMDTDGTCVIVATPFEGPEEASSILTSEIKPVESQFSPSYSLAVNLILRGEGKLDVARTLVQKSFAMWEKQQSEERIASAMKVHGNQFDEVVEAASHERFMEALKEALEMLLEKKRGLSSPKAKSKASKLESCLEVLTDKKLLKKASKSYVGASQILELERNTLKYLQNEAASTDLSLTNDAIDDDVLKELFESDENDIASEIETQRKRVGKSEREVSEHVFTSIATAANNAMKGSNLEAELLRAALASTRRDDSTVDDDAPVTAEELTKFAKSGVVMNRKRRKIKVDNPKSKVNTAALMEHLESVDSYQDDAWEDMLALTNVLEAFGCLTRVSDDNENSDPNERMYEVTQAGVNVGMLGFENSLWCLVAMGGAWDVAHASAELDEFRSSWDTFNDDYLVDTINDDDYSNNEANIQKKKEEENKMPKPQQESETLIELLCSLSPSELAGYISCLVSEGSRGSTSVVESFQTLSPTMQKVVQSTLLSMERLMEVQKKFSVDESSTKCQLELGTCEVVTAWASGCSWNEALEMSGAAPGDLVRTLNRALDALRQLGNLPYEPLRATDLDGVTVQKESRGIHPNIRKMCRDAARAMDRYPVKDPLPFDSDEEEEIYDEIEDGEDNVVEAEIKEGVSPEKS